MVGRASLLAAFTLSSSSVLADAPDLFYPQSFTVKDQAVPACVPLYVDVSNPDTARAKPDHAVSLRSRGKYWRPIFMSREALAALEPKRTYEECALAAGIKLAPAPGVDAEIIAVKWIDPSILDGSFHAYGVDLSTGQLVWDFGRKAEVNFVQPVRDGHTLIGADDGTLALLDTRTGKVRWDVKLGSGTRKRINTFHGEHAKGFLVSDNEEFMWFVGLDGSVLWTMFAKPAPR